MRTGVSVALVAVLVWFAAGAAGAEDSSSAGASGNRTLVVSTWGLGEDVLWRDVYTPFEKKHNCKVVLELGTTPERYTKLAADPNSTVDVIELSQKAAADGYAANLFARIDYSKIPNAKYLISAAKGLTKNGYGPAYTVNSIGIIYNPKAIGFPMKDWADLWRPELANQISIPAITSTFGPAMVYVAADYAKVPVTEDNGAAAFKALAALKKNIVKTYEKSSDLANMLASGEIAAAVVGDFAIPIITKAVPEAKYLVPLSGTYANFNTIDVAAASKNKDLAYAYINWRIGAELQNKTAVSLNEAPINSMVKLSAGQAARMTYGDVARRARTIDYVFVNPLMNGWVDSWNRTLND